MSPTHTRIRPIGGAGGMPPQTPLWGVIPQAGWLPKIAFLVSQPLCGTRAHLARPSFHRHTRAVLAQLLGSLTTLVPSSLAPSKALLSHPKRGPVALGPQDNPASPSTRKAGRGPSFPHLTLLSCVLVSCALWPTLSHAQQWSELAYISSTLGVQDNRICIGESSRGELGCPAYTPTISPTGHTTFTGGLTVNTISLTTSGTTWGYLGSAASYLPNLHVGNGISTTNITATTINGISITSLGGSASPTNVPAFRVHKNGTNQTLTTSTDQLLTWNTKQIDTYDNFNTSTGRFTPTLAGHYLIQLSIGCNNLANTNACVSIIRKNGTPYAIGSTRSPNFDVVTNASAIIYMNGTTDYLDANGYSEATNAVIIGNSTHTYFEGSLLASGNGLVSGTGVSSLSALTDVALASPATGQVLTYNGTSWVNSNPANASATIISGTTSMVSGWPDAIQCSGSAPYYLGVIDSGLAYYYPAFFTSDPNGTTSFTQRSLKFNISTKTWNSAGIVTSLDDDCEGKSIAQLYAEGRAFNFIGNNGGGSALGDRLTSGTLAITANSNTAIVSLTTSGTTWGYMGSNGSYLPNIATNAMQIVSATTPITCDATRAGTLRYNSPTTALELCTGTSWQTMGVGIPAGTISAFASSTCPTGWSEYTPARGRFLRGIDNGAGNDPDGVRAAGAAQADAFQGHALSAQYNTFLTNTVFTSGMASAVLQGNGSPNTTFAKTITTDGINGTPRTATETRPKNVAVTFCQFNGTSNGWNNPLSGGSTSAAGSTGQLQYNTSGSFDANAGLTWDNASQRLNVSGINTGHVSATVVKLADNPANPCDTAALGTLKTINGKVFICRQ